MNEDKNQQNTDYLDDNQDTKIEQDNNSNNDGQNSNNDRQSGKDVIEALDKEIQRRKKELYEVSKLIKEAKEENKKIIDKLREENLSVAIKEVSSKYSLTDEEKELILNEINSKYQDVVSKEKMSDVATSIYYSLHPEKIKEFENLSKEVSSLIDNYKKQEINSSSSSSSDLRQSDFTPEEMAIIQKFKINPETIKKIKENKIGFSLTEGAKEFDY